MIRITARIFVADITDETDDLIGYGIFIEDGDASRMLPDIYGVRSEAHAAVEALPVGTGVRMGYDIGSDSLRAS